MFQVPVIFLVALSSRSFHRFHDSLVVQRLLCSEIGHVIDPQLPNTWELLLDRFASITKVLSHSMGGTHMSDRSNEKLGRSRSLSVKVEGHGWHLTGEAANLKSLVCLKKFVDPSVVASVRCHPPVTLSMRRTSVLVGSIR
ncbi:hypothetical protein DL96DRAFT_1639514 [Flagelloscypha sp. PMI_526]|nr:hypothetical protein DL96DRAFT_1639514 [Flagelloscypha sp. PMI_526]